MHAKLIEELGAGEVVGGVVDVYPNATKGINVFHSSRRNTTNILGTDIAKEIMLAYFSKIDLRL